MNKLQLIIKREYLAKVRNKSFIIMTFLSPILMVLMVFLIGYLTKLNESEKRVIAVLNESSYFSKDFLNNESITYVNFRDIDLQTAKDSTINLGYYGLLYIPHKNDLDMVAKKSFFYAKDTPNSFVINKLERVFKNNIQRHKLQTLGVSIEDFEKIDSNYKINISTYTGELNYKWGNEIKAFVGGGFGYLIMMFIIIYGGFVMRSVIEEKTSRIIEIIISSVKPFQLMLGKIIGTALAGLTQFLIWIIFVGILMMLILFILNIEILNIQDSSNFSLYTEVNMISSIPKEKEILLFYIEEFLKLPWLMIITFFIIYFILGYLIYSSIYAAIGAAVDNETDTQQFIFPIILPLMLAIYVGFFSAISNPNGPIAVGFSLFPLTSPIVMLMRLPSGIGNGGVPIWQLITSIVLLLTTFIGIVWFATKIYRVGILMHGKKPSYKELLKWLNY